MPPIVPSVKILEIHPVCFLLCSFSTQHFFLLDSNSRACMQHNISSNTHEELPINHTLLIITRMLLVWNLQLLQSLFINTRREKKLEKRPPSVSGKAMLTSDNACDPPLAKSYQALFHDSKKIQQHSYGQDHEVIRKCELPLIDLRGLRSSDGEERGACAEAIAKASTEWGFFQVLNHGISKELLEEMRREQMKLFRMPFEKKISSRLLNDSYRWGTPTATSLKQFSWSEAFHVPLAQISDENCYGEFSSLREVMERLAGAMSELARMLAGALAENLGHNSHGFPENCNKNTCFLRLNRYPSCPFSPKTFGLTPHTDSDFLTILHQDQVGGLQLMKNSKWVAVRPNPDALIVNIGDLFQAWSNDIYKSVEHKVMANGKMERYSIAYFLCPSYGSTIGSCKEPSLYKSFTFGEFRQQVQEDVKRFGQKVGLRRFLL